MNWKDILKEWEPKRLKPKPKAIDTILEYLARNTQGSTIKGIVRDLNLHMKPARLRRILNEHPKVSSMYDYISTTGRRILYFHK